MSDPYRVLGVPRGADQAQIKAAHRRLAKRHHPDAGAQDEQRFLAIQEAYRLLSDPLRRREWDRQHGPGPVDARDRAQRPRSRSASAHWTREDTAAYRRGRQPRRGPTAEAPSDRSGRPADGSGPPAGGGGREPGTRRHTWSAEGIPWWEDFSPRQRPAAGRSGAPGAAAHQGGPTAAAGSPAAPQGMDFEVFNRSSGAAWSSAARRHFRRDASDLPSRGAFRYRGSQVVTGAEARKVAAEEAIFRRSASTPAAPRQAFDHDPAPAPSGTPARARAPVPARSAVRPTPRPASAPRQERAAPTPEAPAPAGGPGTITGGLGALAGAVAVGVPTAAGLVASTDGSPPVLLLPLVLVAGLLGAVAGYLLAHRSRPRRGPR